MGAAAFDNAAVFLFQTAEGGNQQINGREELVFNGKDRRNMHGGGESVIGRLAHIDVIIGMQQLFAGNFIAAVGNDLVGVHVGLGAAAGLPDDQGEVVVQSAADDLVASLGNRRQFFVGHLLRLQGVIGLGGSLFQDAKGMGNFPGHRFDSYADEEILMAAFGLCCPIFIRRHLDFAHGIVLDPVLLFFLFHFYRSLSYIKSEQNLQYRPAGGRWPPVCRSF